MEQLDGIEYMTPREVATLKSTSEAAIWRAIKLGQLEGVKRLDRWLIRPEDAHAWTPGTWGDISRMKKEAEK